jgi:hypothetical protein
MLKMEILDVVVVGAGKRMAFISIEMLKDQQKDSKQAYIYQVGLGWLRPRLAISYIPKNLWRSSTQLPHLVALGRNIAFIQA